MATRKLDGARDRQAAWPRSTGSPGTPQAVCQTGSSTRETRAGLCSSSRNVARNSTDSALPGTRTSDREGRQGSSVARPPPVTLACTGGWERRSRGQVCSPPYRSGRRRPWAPRPMPVRPRPHGAPGGCRGSAGESVPRLSVPEGVCRGAGSAAPARAHAVGVPGMARPGHAGTWGRGGLYRRGRGQETPGSWPTESVARRAPPGGLAP